MSKYLNHNSKLQCTHMGQVILIPPPMRSLWVMQSPVLTDMDLMQTMIVGCPQIGIGVKPCIKIVSIMMGRAIKIDVDGQTPILSSLQAMTDGVPPGMVTAIFDGMSNAEPAPFSIAAASLAMAARLGSALCLPCMGSPPGPSSALNKLSPQDAKSGSLIAYKGEKGQRTEDGKWEVEEVNHTWATGYRSVVLKSTDPNDPRHMLAFAGTVPTNPIDDLTDISQELGGVPPAYLQALADTERLKAQYGDNLVLTGHSLGGGEANFASEMAGVPAVTINSAPLGVGTRAMIAVFGADNAGQNSVTLRVGDDAVSVLAAVPLLAGHPGAVVDVPRGDSTNPLNDHFLPNFDASKVPNYQGPVRESSSDPATDLSGPPAMPGEGSE